MEDKPSFNLEGFTELAEHSTAVASPGVLVRKVVSVGEDERLQIGDLLRIDTSKREPKYSEKFAVRLEEREALVRLGPRRGRPKDGPRGLCLERGWRDDPRAVPVTPDEFEKICIGRLVGGYREQPSSPMSPIEREELDRRLQHSQEADAAEAAAEKAALAAGWRARPRPSRLPDWCTEPDFDNFDRHADEGAYPIDRVVRRLLDLGRIQFEYFDRDSDGPGPVPFTDARFTVLSSQRMVAMLARNEADVSQQDKANQSVITGRIDRMLDDIDGFLSHVGYDCAHLFIGPDDEPPPDENKPHKWLLDEAAGRLFTAQHALEEARDKLRHLRNAMGQSPAYRHDGAKDVVVAEFLPQMAFAWFHLTGEVPGKTGNGLFADFCLAAWKTLGWPADDEDRLWAGFVRRIERGEHRRYYPQSSG